MNLIISCEHAGRNIPDEYLKYFHLHQEIIETHLGWDPGAWEVACYMGEKLGVPYFGCQTTRLLIEVNRSLSHPQLFSEFSNPLSKDEKKKLVENVYRPYRQSIEGLIRNSTQPVLHLSIHSFTPVLNGMERDLEIGLLFDPRRSEEISFCEDLAIKLSGELPGLRIKFNEPYKGTDDGFTTYLRSRFDNEFYRGVEIEINQRLVGIRDWQLIKEALVNCTMFYKFSS